MTLISAAKYLLATVGLGLFAASITAFAADNPGSQLSAQQLIREVVNTEVKAADSDHTHWMYRQHHVDPTKDILQECVQTKEGEICRHLAENGHPLTGNEQQQEQKRIHSLLDNPDQERKAQKARNHDGDEAVGMLKMLPNAFLYTFDGQDGDFVRLKFEPNPNFTPPSREARVFHAMTGTVLVDSKAKRLAELRGKLFKDVDFGWGLLGKLYQGGTFLVKRAEVGDGHWDSTLMDVNIHGKALFFHTINAQQREATTDYTKVSDALSLAQGASMLLAPNTQSKTAAAASGGN